MKIAFLSYYQNINLRGNETFVAEVSSHLVKNHQVEILAETKSLVVFEKYRPGWRFFLDPQSLAIKKFTQTSLSGLNGADIVFATNGGWQTLLCRLWCWQHHAKLVISGQSGPGWDDRINLLCRPDVFVALTNYQAKWARKNPLGVKVVKIPNGVDLEKFHPGVKPAALDLPRPLFICVAALEEGKHVDQIIKAVAALGKGSLVVLGQGKLKADLKLLAGQLLPNRFLITSVPHDKINAFYAVADVVTMLPPRTESFGIVFLEAMATNKPVVTSNDPSRREIVGNAGIFVNFEDIDDYTRGLKEALEKSWADLPRRQAEKFSWDKITREYEDLFRSL